MALEISHFGPQYEGNELVRFRSYDCHQKFYKFLDDKPVVEEKSIKLSDFPNEIDWVRRRGWLGVMNVNGLVCVGICRELIANFDNDESAYEDRDEDDDENVPAEARIVTSVRGHRLEITPQTFRDLYGIGNFVPLEEGEEEYEFTDDELTFEDRASSYRSTLGELLKTGGSWPTKVVKKGEIKDEYYLIMAASFSNILPLMREADVDGKRALIIYAISHKWQFDLAEYMFRVLYDYMHNKHTGRSAIPFGITLTTLACRLLSSGEKRQLVTFRSRKTITRVTVNKKEGVAKARKRERGEEASSSARRGEEEEEDYCPYSMDARFEELNDTQVELGLTMSRLELGQQELRQGQADMRAEMREGHQQILAQLQQMQLMYQQSFPPHP